MRTTKRLRHMDAKLAEELALPVSKRNLTWITTQRICIDMIKQTLEDLEAVLAAAENVVAGEHGFTYSPTIEKALRDALAGLD